MSNYNYIHQLIREPEQEYHQQRKHYLTSHAVIDYIRCPYSYYLKHCLYRDDKTDTPAYMIGRAAHKLILEGEGAFYDEYSVGGPINPTTGKAFGQNTKKFAEWAALQTKPFVSEDSYDLINRMHDGFLQNTLATQLVENGVAEGVLRTIYCEMACQIRIDMFSPNYGIIDLKTCDDLDYFCSDAKKYRYHNQLAFYQAVAREVVQDEIPVYFIAVEKREPFRCGVWKITQTSLDTARLMNERAIRSLIESRANNEWLTGYEEMRIMDI